MKQPTQSQCPNTWIASNQRFLGTLKEQGPPNCTNFHKGTEEKRGHQGSGEGNKIKLCFFYVCLSVFLLYYIHSPSTKNYEEGKRAGCQREESSKALAIAGLSPQTRAWVPCPSSGRFRRLEEGQWSQSLSLHSLHRGMGGPGDLHLPYHRLKPQIHVKSGISIEECSCVKEGSVPKAISLLLP